MMPCLTIKLFGPPQIELDGVALRLEGRIPVALLAYLAVTGQLHTRDALATLFWPESAKARNYLRNNLWIITEALGAWGKEWLYSDHETLGFQPQADVWLDVAHFSSHLAVCGGHAHPEHEVCAACLAHLHQAVDLCRNDFLAGFTLRNSTAFDEWQFFQRERLRREFASVLERLLCYHRDQGEYEAAIRHARRWLALDPAHEPAHRHLMQLYAWSGQHAAALRQYQACVRILTTELDAPPDEETKALYEQIRSRQLPDRVTGRQGDKGQGARDKEQQSKIQNR
jgi:DNA-binding SARP family transcriptional activator